LPAAPPDRPRQRASVDAHIDDQILGPALPAAKPRPQGRRLAAEVERLQTELLAAQAGLAELQALVDVDSLTGIFNRRGFERELERALAFAARYGNAAALVFVDLDGFKLVNDVYGHGAGDVVLQGVAALLQRMVRGSDTVARIGGDEFALLLWNLDGQQAARKARAVQDALAQMRTQHEGRTIEVGASAGVAVIASGDTLAHAMARADAAMYEDKRARQCAGRKKGTA
jgi:diguanylate cyclase (GGDEF)-like protein